MPLPILNPHSEIADPGAWETLIKILANPEEVGLMTTDMLAHFLRMSAVVVFDPQHCASKGPGDWYLYNGELTLQANGKWAEECYAFEDWRELMLLLLADTIHQFEEHDGEQSYCPKCTEDTNYLGNQPGLVQDND